MQNFTFVIKHISGTANKVADALSRKCLLFQEFKVKMLGLDDLKNMYADDQNFKEVYEAIENPFLGDTSQWVEYMIQEGLLFKGNQICIPKCSMRENFDATQPSSTYSSEGPCAHDLSFTTGLKNSRK
jgi:hypothetical protein